MADGVIESKQMTDGSSYIKFENGFMVAWGSARVNTDTKGSKYGYWGETTLDVSSFGFKTLIVGFGNGTQFTAWWNAGVTQLNSTEKTIILSMASGANTIGSMRWFVFGTWR